MGKISTTEDSADQRGMLSVEKPRWPLTGPVVTYRPGVYSALPSQHSPESCGASRITHAGRAQVVREPEGPFEVKKIPLRRSREYERREFAFRPVTGAAENMFFQMKGFLHPSRCVLAQFHA